MTDHLTYYATWYFLWLFSMFLSTLIHELGHAVMLKILFDDNGWHIHMGMGKPIFQSQKLTITHGSLFQVIVKQNPFSKEGYINLFYFRLVVLL